MKTIKQAEIWLTDLNPIKGSEQVGVRPVVIISGNLMNKHLNIVIICPLTSKVKTYKGNVVLEPSTKNKLTQSSEILTFHVRSISKHRLIKKVGSISAAELQQIKQCLDDILRY